MIIKIVVVVSKIIFIRLTTSYYLYLTLDSFGYEVSNNFFDF